MRNAKNASDGTNGRLNSYLASMGTTAQNGYNTSATGLFAFNISYGLRDITDGSSNTIAFSEKLVGTPGQSTGMGLGYPGNGVANGNPSQNVYDATQNPTQTLTDLTSCNSAWNLPSPGRAANVPSGKNTSEFPLVAVRSTRRASCGGTLCQASCE